jgi:hypothetical protein
MVRRTPHTNTRGRRHATSVRTSTAISRTHTRPRGPRHLGFRSSPLPNPSLCCQLETAGARADQRADDLAAEVAHLQRVRDALVRPKGLSWGLVVLGAFTVVGVAFPLWLLSRAPKQLTPGLGEVVFWLFMVGLLALLGYITSPALRLSGGRLRVESGPDRPLGEARLDRFTAA